MTPRWRTAVVTGSGVEALLAGLHTGSLADVEVLLAEARARGLEVLLDEVPAGPAAPVVAFALLDAPWDAAAWRAVVHEALAALAPVGARPVWVLPEHPSGTARAAVATTVLLSLPGTPLLGDEREPGDLRHRLVRARHASPALDRGELQWVRAPEGVLALLRRDGGDVRLLVANLGAAPATVLVPRSYAVGLSSDGTGEGAEWDGAVGPEQALVLHPIVV